jgi:hypothetical protein
MKNLKSNKAFQNILKNAPEMPLSQIPGENPKSGNGNEGMVLTLAVVFIGQFLTLIALDKIIKGQSGKITYIPMKPMNGDSALPNTKIPPTEVKS